MPRPIHFEIPAENPQRAIDFYSKLFGWKFQKWEGPVEYWLIETGDPAEPGIDGGLMPRQHPNQPCANTVGVADVDATLAAAVAGGGAVALPKMPVPGVGWLAYIKDTEGHILGIMQMDANAK